MRWCLTVNKTSVFLSAGVGKAVIIWSRFSRFHAWFKERGHPQQKIGKKPQTVLVGRPLHRVFGRYKQAAEIEFDCGRNFIDIPRTGKKCLNTRKGFINYLQASLGWLFVICWVSCSTGIAALVGTLPPKAFIELCSTRVQVGLCSWVQLQSWIWRWKITVAKIWQLKEKIIFLFYDNVNIYAKGTARNYSLFNFCKCNSLRRLFWIQRAQVCVLKLKGCHFEPVAILILLSLSHDGASWLTGQVWGSVPCYGTSDSIIDATARNQYC